MAIKSNVSNPVRHSVHAAIVGTHTPAWAFGAIVTIVHSTPKGRHPMGPLTRDSVQAMLRTNDKALARGIVAIYRRQLADEQHARATLHDNGVGFNSADAGPMSTLARDILTGDPGLITPARMEDARERMPKYWAQLIDIAVDRMLTQMTEPPPG